LNCSPEHLKAIEIESQVVQTQTNIAEGKRESQRLPKTFDLGALQRSAGNTRQRQGSIVFQKKVLSRTLFQIKMQQSLQNLALQQSSALES
jgi:hypothetical protein